MADNVRLFQPGETPTQGGGALNALTIPGGTGGTVSVPVGTNLVFNGAENPLTIGGGATVSASAAGSDFLIAGRTQLSSRFASRLKSTPTGSGASPQSTVPQGTIIVDNGGSTTVTVNAGIFVDHGASGADNVTALAGRIVVAGAGNDTISAPSGKNSIDGGLGENRIVLGTGQNLVFSSGQDTISMGSGNATIIGADGAGSAPDILIQGGGGTLNFLNGVGNATVTTGSGSVTVHGGEGGGLFQGGSAGNNLLITGQNASTLVGGGPGDRLIANNAANNVLLASSGNVTLDGSVGTGNNQFTGGTTPRSETVIFTGSGNDTVIGGRGQATVHGSDGDDVIIAARCGGTIMTGSGNETISLGRGRDVVEFVNGEAGGEDVLFGFKLHSDKIVLTGYGPDAISQALASAHAVEDGVAFSLPDGTEVTVEGVTRLTSAYFQLG